MTRFEYQGEAYEVADNPRTDDEVSGVVTRVSNGERMRWRVSGTALLCARGEQDIRAERSLAIAKAVRRLQILAAPVSPEPEGE